MIDYIKNPKTGKKVLVFVCEFKDDLAIGPYITADGQIKDFCQVHLLQAMNADYDAENQLKAMKALSEARAKRLEELKTQ
jgi:hypothetical protein